MKKPSLNFVLEHGITLLTGTLLGATLTAGMTYDSSKDFWQTFGSLSAGFGTLAILLFGWMKAEDWIQQIKSEKRIHLALKQANDLVTETKTFLRYFENEYANYPDSGSLDNEEKLMDRYKTLQQSHGNIYALLKLNQIQEPNEVSVLDTYLDELFDEIVSVEFSRDKVLTLLKNAEEESQELESSIIRALLK